MTAPNDFRAEHGFGVGSIIEYQPFGGGTRRVRVEFIDEDIKNGRPGFDGVLEDDDGSTVRQADDMVWGYCSQVTRVVTP